MTTHLAFAVTNKTKVIWIKTELFSFPWQMPFLEGADSVSWQLHRDKESPFSGTAILAEFGGRCWKTMLGLARNIHFLDLCLYWACLNSWNLKWTSWDILLADGKHFTMDIIWCPKGRERVNSVSNDCTNTVLCTAGSNLATAFIAADWLLEWLT